VKYMKYKFVIPTLSWPKGKDPCILSAAPTPNFTRSRRDARAEPLLRVPDCLDQVP